MRVISRVISRAILRVLAWLILAYRRWLSGRGPLRGVRCSFAHEESCSAFGLRATAEAPTAREAIRRIAGRLGRCRDAWLLGDGATLSWAALHDRPPEAIAAELARDGERPPAIARMLGTRRAVALWRARCAGSRQVARAERIAARWLAGVASAARPLVCSHPATLARSRRRIAGFIALAGAAAFALAFQPWLGAVTLLIAAIASARATHTAAARAARFALHAALFRMRRAEPSARGTGAPAQLRASAA